MVAKPKPVKSKKSDYKKLENECDTLTSLVVRLRDGKCVCCGSTEQLTCGHYISRDKALLRYNTKNCNAQCWGCNVKHRYYPNFYAAAMYRKYGKKTMDELDRLANIPAWKWSYNALVEIRDGLKSELERLQERTVYIDK